MFDLKGKIALITGGASGIGYSTTKEILRAGAEGVAIADMNEINGKTLIEELTEEFGSNRAIFLKTDVTKKEELEGAFETTARTWKKIDVLINNAGIFNDAIWEKEISINVNGLVRGTLLGLQYMSKQYGGKGGVIVNISSTLGLQEGISGPIYTGTKHFVIGFTRSLGTPYHFEQTGVRFISICPGPSDTNMPFTLERSGEYFLFPELREQYIKEFENSVRQPPKNVADAIITCIRSASTGSIWVSEDNKKAYEIKIPNRETLRK